MDEQFNHWMDGECNPSNDALKEGREKKKRRANKDITNEGGTQNSRQQYHKRGKNNE